MKVRMMGNPLFVDTMNAMGGNGISMAYGEVFSALQTGVIDGAENNPPSMFTSNHYTTGAKYYAQTNHLIIPEILVMSKVTWDKLTPADQALVKKMGREAQLDQRRCGIRASRNIRPSSRPRASSLCRSTRSFSLMRRLRCAPNMAPSSRT
ncbi:TRAP transporter substrate-binding protein DctP [Polaromonas sp. P2-4]|nr:TRAP transporter substrate-binding protein DctP [Polaromonas sp. P2-4]